MLVLAGGVGAFVLGLIGIFIWWEQFLSLLKGALPAIFVLGGALAAYLGYDELKEKKRESAQREDETTQLRQKIESLEKELKELKAEKPKEDSPGS